MRSRSPSVALLLALAASACTRVGVPPTALGPRPTSAEIDPTDPLPDHRTYTGTTSIGGAPFALDLELDRVRATTFDAVMRIGRLGLEASGRGTASGERIELRLTYGGSCEGTLAISAALERGGTVGRGTLEASDCTGTEEGPLSLTLSSGTIAIPDAGRSR